MVPNIVSKLLLLAAIGLFLVACTSSSASSAATFEPIETSVPTADATAEPDPAPAFTLTSLEGETISLSSYEGEWLILNFWATWCPPCVSEMPYLQSLADRGLNVVGINMAETPEEVEPFLMEHGIKFPILMEPDINTVLDYQARQLPRTVIIAPDGNIALRISGPIDGEQLDPWLADRGVQ